MTRWKRDIVKSCMIAVWFAVTHIHLTDLSMRLIQQVRSRCNICTCSDVVEIGFWSRKVIQQSVAPTQKLQKSCMICCMTCCMTCCMICPCSGGRPIQRAHPDFKWVWGLVMMGIGAGFWWLDVNHAAADQEKPRYKTIESIWAMEYTAAWG